VNFPLVDGQLGDDTGIDGTIFDVGEPITPTPIAVPASSLALLTALVVSILSGPIIWESRRRY
jgi:hypothetical protein